MAFASVALRLSPSWLLLALACQPVQGPKPGADEDGGGGAATGGQGSGGLGTGGTPQGGGGGSEPSAGCGKPSPVSGARTLVLPEDDGDDGAFIVSLPSNYDANKAYPLGFAFHGWGRTHAECQAGDCAGFQTVMGQEAVLVYMKSVDQGWEDAASNIRGRNVEFWRRVLEVAKTDYCIDPARVFVAGTSSGAHFTNILACRFGDKLLAASPVAGYLPEKDGCVGEVAALPIHGIDDSHVTFDQGEMARDFYVERNGCTTTTVPELSTLHAEIRASRDAAQTNIGCVDYQGCDAGKLVRWCEHSEGGYDNSTHGWPTAGGQLIWDFVKALP